MAILRPMYHVITSKPILKEHFFSTIFPEFLQLCLSCSTTAFVTHLKILFVCALDNLRIRDKAIENGVAPQFFFTFCCHVNTFHANCQICQCHNCVRFSLQKCKGGLFALFLSIDENQTKWLKFTEWPFHSVY